LEVYPIDLAAWKMMIKSSEAIIGEKSNMPIRGMNCRIGDSIGSVMSCMILKSGFSGSIEIQEKTILSVMATRRMAASIWTNSARASILSS
jgi:hypothetical protein